MRHRSRRTAGTIMTAVAVGAAALAGPAMASPGDLDTAFGTGGKAETSFSQQNGANAVVILSDGTIVVAGNYGRNSDFAVARFTAAGALDPGFGSGGLVTTSFGTKYDRARALAVQSDGKIVVVGTTGVSPGKWAIARYTANGTPDASFSGDGKLTTSFPAGSYQGAQGVAIQDDGKIVVAGDAWGTPSLDFAIARYKPNGRLDPAFGGGDGEVTVDWHGDADSAGAVALHGNRIVAAGYAGTGVSLETDFGLLELTPEGDLDSGFGGGTGKVQTDFGGSSGPDYGNSIALYPGNRIMVGGIGDSTNFAVARYNADGSPDPTFSGDGKRLTGFGGSQQFGTSLAVLPSGRIVQGGEAFVPGAGRDEFAIAQYTISGTLDWRTTTPFGAGGGLDSGINGVAVTASSRIVAVGQERGSTTAQMALARYQS